MARARFIHLSMISLVLIACAVIQSAAAVPATRPASQPLSADQQEYERMTRELAVLEPKVAASLAIVRAYRRVYLQPRPPVLNNFTQLVLAIDAVDAPAAETKGLYLSRLEFEVDGRTSISGKAKNAGMLAAFLKTLQKRPAVLHAELKDDPQRTALIAAGAGELPFLITYRYEPVEGVDDTGPVVQDEWARKRLNVAYRLNEAKTSAEKAPGLVAKSAGMADFLNRDQEAQEWRLRGALEYWAKRAEVEITSIAVTPAKQRSPGGGIEMSVEASARQATAVHYLWMIDTSAVIPIRLTHVGLISRGEGKDELILQLRVALLNLPDGKDPLAALAPATRP